MYQRSIKNQENVYRFLTLPRPLPMNWWYSNIDPAIEMHIAPSQSTKDFYAQMKNLSIHPKSRTKIFNHSKLEEIRLL
jgi:hypothetical protein